MHWVWKHLDGVVVKMGRERGKRVAEREEGRVGEEVEGEREKEGGRERRR